MAKGCGYARLPYNNYYYIVDSLASVTSEAVRMVGVSQSCDHPPLHVVPTAPALGTKLDMVVLAAIVALVLHEVATRGQEIATH